MGYEQLSSTVGANRHTHTLIIKADGLKLKYAQCKTKVY